MNRLPIAALALLASTYSTAQTNLAELEPGFYAGAAVSRMQYRQLVPEAELHLETLELNAGFWFHPLLSGEVRVGTGLGDRETELGAAVWEINVEGYASAYWRPEIGNATAKLYALLGYSQVKINAQVPGAGVGGGAQQTANLSESGPSFGIGVGFSYSPEVKLNLEWKQLIDTDGFEMSGFTAGADYRF